ncbi:hypothetical protein [Mycobacterium sp.]|jgi:hypothetical protein|uniref:hypothetical protein n=1 Tax=Mycobacterium sp. TaxID=1785 RepID=UPI002D708B3F|nr:hypothetical protein [Mycobacterium sp.]HZA09084.1 hypothetical protein [Mycobacterium sp.]
MNKTLVGLTTTALVSAGMGLAGLGLAAGTAQAEPGPFPTYHWCPGDFWDQGWGFNWDWGRCHDDHHADADGWDHSRDWWGDQRGDRDRGGPPPWQPWWPH